MHQKRKKSIQLFISYYLKGIVDMKWNKNTSSEELRYGTDPKSPFTWTVLEQY